jgi:hypothetical protein
MRIIGKQHDYYDSALAHGHDDRVLYVRDKQIIPYDSKVHGQFYAPLRISDISNGDLAAYLEAFSVCFCGKLYMGMEVSTQTYGYVRTNKRICYSIDELMTFMNEHQLTFESSKHNQVLSKQQKQRLETYFSRNGTDMPLQYMIDNKYAIMSFKRVFFPDRDTEVAVNGTLKELEFYRVMDAYQAYQELDMFVGGVLTQCDKMVDTVADKDRIVQHGFDKYSFRKPPEK